VLSHQELIHIIAANGYWIVALAIGLECLGLPVPGESILVAAAVYAGSSHALNITLVIGAAAFGAILGNAIGFWIGREGGYRLLLRYGRRFGMTDGRIKLGQYLFLKHGGKIVFFGRFVAGLRVFVGIFAGANRMSWRSFLFLTSRAQLFGQYFMALVPTIWVGNCISLLGISRLARHLPP